MNRALPEEWEWKRLRDIFIELFAGGDIPKGHFSKTITEEYNIPIFTNGERNNGLYGFTNIAKVTKPSITISARGTIGYSEIRNNPFYPAIRLIVATPKSNVDILYLQYAIKKTEFKNNGNSIPQLTLPMVQEYFIPLPPLPEQRRIAAIIDAQFAAVEKARQAAEEQMVYINAIPTSILRRSFNEEL
jgi:type I restriction enzyme S subunit